VTAYKIEFEPIGRRGECPAGQSLLGCARRLGIGIASVCGGQGTCRSCKVQILDGNTSEATSSETEWLSADELKTGWRLACQAYPLSDCKLHIPAESMTAPQRLQLEWLEVRTRPEPAVKGYQVKLQPPSLSDLTADADRLLQSLNRQHKLHCHRVDIELLRHLPPQLRSLDWKCQAAVRDDEVTALSPWQSAQLGLAVDLGTTKIAAYLVDLKEGRTLAAKGVMNPQISYGEDVVSRIQAAISSIETAEKLQKVVAEALNQLISDLYAQVNADQNEIVDMVVVGNTAMHHLFLKLPVLQLAHSPFVPAVSHAVDVKARELGLHIAQGAYVHLLPNIAGFVGADHVAMLTATQNLWVKKDVVIALDIGTNTEVSLIREGKITSVSCASGPAFEGGHIKGGMRAAPGAIERVRIDSQGVHYQTVDAIPPVGICGSGILDAMAQLYLAGIIDEGGRMKEEQARVRRQNNHLEFVLVEEDKKHKRSAVVITQNDIRELQLAKAAIRTGIQVLLEANNCSEEDITKVFIAGAFGTYIDISSAITIGMLPTLPLERFQLLGNAAGMGAKLALISLNKRAEAQMLSRKVRYLELASAPGFNQTFIQAGYLGRYRLLKGRREEIK